MSAWTVIDHEEVPSGGVASIEFTSIPATYTDLVILGSFRFERNTVDSTLGIEFDGNNANYTRRLLYGDGSATGSQAPTYIGWQSANTSTANTFGNFMIYIPNYAGSQGKSFSADVVMENNATGSFQVITAGVWANSSPIYSIRLFEEALGLDIAQYSSATLYGITKGSSGGVTVS